PPEKADWMSRVFGEWGDRPIDWGIDLLSAPLTGATRARERVNPYRNDAAVENLKRRFTTDKFREYLAEDHIDPYKLDDVRNNPRAASVVRDHYARAQEFLRVFTFTCAEEFEALVRAGVPGNHGGLDELQTMNWLVSDSEYKAIVEKWFTFNNQNRFHML